jgi:hypothetical protein
VPATPITISRREADDIILALDYASEDLQYRLRQNADYTVAADIKRIEAKLDRWSKLVEKLAKETRS